MKSCNEKLIENIISNYDKNDLTINEEASLSYSNFALTLVNYENN